MKRSIDNNNDNTQSKKKILNREAIFWICRQGKVDELKEIVDSDDYIIDMSSQDFKSSPFLAACDNDHHEIVKLIVSNAHKFGKNPRMEKALENACLRKSYSMVKLLLSFTHSQDDIETMIAFSVKENDPKLLEMALDNKLNSGLDFTLDMLSSDMENAAAMGKIALVKLFMEHNKAIMAKLIEDAIDTAENSECDVDQTDIDECIDYLKKQQKSFLPK
jgi:ankyrin repeat protein